MNTTREIKFESPTFARRIKGMLGVDFYRLFHTPLFYIFLAIAAIIPAMVSAMTMMPDQSGQTMEPLYSNVWQIIAASKSLYVIEGIADYANMNMVFIFGGMMVSIFIGHDYKSGYVKQLFTTHAKKQDYMISKSLVCAFAMACMCITYLIGGTVGGLFVGYDTDVNVGSLMIAILGKIIMSLGWASLYTFLNVIFRKYFGISVASSFFFGTGILIIGAAAIVEGLGLPASFLNIFLYGASVNANLSSGFGALLTCMGVSVAWTVIYNLVGTLILNKSDVY
ncbi:MAG: ABC transporter permease [Ruminococcaceae bacterium]|nr:ABC transporter permease [Oscillospiraceae bacterium]